MKQSVILAGVLLTCSNLSFAYDDRDKVLTALQTDHPQIDGYRTILMLLTGLRLVHDNH